MTSRRGWRAKGIALGASLLLAGCFPYTPADMRPPADAPAPLLVPPLPVSIPTAAVQAPSSAAVLSRPVLVRTP